VTAHVSPGVGADAVLDSNLDSIASLRRALDPAVMRELLAADVEAVELLSLKPGRRAVVRYDTPDGALIGKVRAGHRPTSPFRLMQRFRAAGLDDGPVRVAEPVAVIEDLEMWVQRAAPGTPGNLLLAGLTTAVDVATAAAAAIHRVHLAGVPTKRTHTIDHELDVLARRLAATADVRPDLAHRLHRLEAACARRAIGADDVASRGGAIGIHRDAYADQFLFTGLDNPVAVGSPEGGHSRAPGTDVVTTVIDFDLYCLGDPALDVGNFVAHLTEHALRVTGDAAALEAAESACREAFLELAGQRHELAVDAYTDLTLARHVALSTTVPGRSHLTDAILALCEARLH
jgi:hypothetical protein